MGRAGSNGWASFPCLGLDWGVRTVMKECLGPSLAVLSRLLAVGVVLDWMRLVVADWLGGI